MVADFRSAPSSICLKSSGGNKESLLEFLSPCERSLPEMSHLNYLCNRQRTLRQDGDYSNNDPHFVPGFLHHCSGMFPERFQKLSVPVGWREVRLILTELPRCRTLSCEFLGQFLSDPASSVLRNLRDIFLSISRNRCVLWLAVASCVFPHTAANFRSFPNFTVSSGENVQQWWRLQCFAPLK